MVIFGVDMSSSPHIDNKGKDLLILGKGPTQGFGGHFLTVQKLLHLNKKILKLLQLHYA